MQLQGLGEYPDETCFDASRPSWLPYWLNDLTESQCEINLLLTGNTTGNTAQPGQAGVAASTLANAQAACTAGGGTWDPNAQVCNNPLVQYGPWLIGGALAIAFLITSIKK
jgi:hypothetical protein